jgi:hypothetical protein
MRQFKYIGTQEQANNYEKCIPKSGEVYKWYDEIGGGITVLEWATEWGEKIGKEWLEVIEPTSDKVNSPHHYTQGDVECVDAIKSATINKKGIEAVCVANIIKYLWRYEEKGGIESVEKAEWYLKRLLLELEKA